KDQGVKYNFDVLGMLVEHNAAVFYLWLGIYPDTNPVIEILQAHL
ncbi:shikimate dehydrogenase, partial [Coxiella endosymbiont of Ornithodoros amblus]|nr:shikimate dehydrogenase [Coxiella endosymbiont of Ornithodoros amblus]